MYVYALRQTFRAGNNEYHIALELKLDNVLSRKYPPFWLDFSILPKIDEIFQVYFLTLYTGFSLKKVPTWILHFPYICEVMCSQKTSKVRKCKMGKYSCKSEKGLMETPDPDDGKWLLICLAFERLFRQFVVFWLGFCRDDSVISKTSAKDIFSA